MNCIGNLPKLQATISVSSKIIIIMIITINGYRISLHKSNDLVQKPIVNLHLSYTDYKITSFKHVSI